MTSASNSHSSGAPLPRVALIALPESSASVLYGLYDVLSTVGALWTELTGEPSSRCGFDVHILSLTKEAFRCWGGIPVAPHNSLSESGPYDIIIVSDLAIPLDLDPRGTWPEVTSWLRAQYENGALVTAVCTGSLVLADAGLLDNEEATTHWAFQSFFSRYFPSVTLQMGQVLVPSGADRRIITAGGSTSWEDLALHLISRYFGQDETVKTAKIFLLGDRSDGQLPYAAMPKPPRHDDAAISDSQAWIAENYTLTSPVARMAERAKLSERTFKRRFRAATGYTPVAYVQTLRIEEAKQFLETTSLPSDEIALNVGYEDPAFFRRLFKRQTGITPGRYRQRFQAMGRFAVEGSDKAG